jgi:hypothetical protein
MHTAFWSENLKAGDHLGGYEDNIKMDIKNGVGGCRVDLSGSG